MRTLTFTIQFSDGATITGKASSASAELEVPVEYTGDASRLGDVFVESDLGFLEWFLVNRCRALGATLNLEAVGEYERFAQ